MLLRQGCRAVLLFVAFLLLSSRYALAEDPSFELGGKAGNATGILTKEEFELKVDIGRLTDYSSNNPNKFNLTIGNCPIAIEAYSVPATKVIQFRLQNVRNTAQSTVDTLKSISVNSSSGVMFSGDNNASIACLVDFEEKASEKYQILIELSGDVPTTFKLSSTEVKMGESDSNEKAAGAELSMGEIIGIVAGCVGGLLLASSIAGFVAYHRCYKKKALQKQQLREQLKTAKSVEAVPKPSEATDTKDKKSEPKSVSTKDKPKDKKEAKKSKSDPKSSRNKDKKKKNARAKKSNNDSGPTSERKSGHKSEMNSRKDASARSARSSFFNKPKGKPGKEQSGPYVRMDEVISERDD